MIKIGLLIFAVVALLALNAIVICEYVNSCNKLRKKQKQLKRWN
jgi:hypothetical protein